MSSALVESVLLDIDGPQLLVLRDKGDGKWLALAVDRSMKGDEFLCVQVSKARLAAYRHGDIDLLSMYVAPEAGDLHRLLIAAKATRDTWFKLEQLKGAPPPEWLPGAGSFLTEYLPVFSEDVRVIAAESAERNRPIVHLIVDPPEARESPIIDAKRLSDILRVFENATQQAYFRSPEGMSNSARKSRPSPDKYSYQVFAYAQGSFEIHMQAKGDPDLFGDVPPLTAALRKLDELASVVDDTELAVQVAQANRGHFINAFQSLLKFVAESETPLRYAWTEPVQNEVRQVVIRPAPAQIPYDVLTTKAALSEVTTELTGVFIHAHVNSRAWTLETADGEKHAGTTADDSEVSFSGVVLKERVYFLRCRERLVEAIGTGRQTTRLELVEFAAKTEPSL